MYMHTYVSMRDEIDQEDEDELINIVHCLNKDYESNYSRVTTALLSNSSRLVSRSCVC